MNELRAFEAAARHQNFTTAAAELNLSQSAVSRLVRALEEIVGGELFIRERQTVRLNPTGELYASEIRKALHGISAATLSVRTNPSGGTLSLAILPTFGTRWLAPRLPDFLASHPGITINLSTRFSPFNFQLEGLDAAIHFGTATWPGANLDELMGETIVPACSAEMRDALRITKPEDLKAAPLLHLASRPDLWTQWFRTMGVEGEVSMGMVADQFAVVAQAAICGVGVALLPLMLIRQELERGELVVAVEKPMASSDKYFLAWPAHRENHPPLRAFRTWISEQAASHATACSAAATVEVAARASTLRNKIVSSF